MLIWANSNDRFIHLFETFVSYTCTAKARKCFLAFSKILKKFYLLIPYALKLFCLVLFSRFFVNIAQVRATIWKGLVVIPYSGANPERGRLVVGRVEWV
jgi:hypothetical protein